ncbi:MAG: hypothetical protein ABI623_06605 [bacterium]
MKHLIYLALTMALTIAYARAGGDEEGDLFVHPFFSHMSLADPVGEVSFRFTGIQRRAGDELGGDVGVHIEAGILPGLGIHIRSDGIKSETFSEVMMMYNVFTTANQNFGVSLFGQVSIPTGPEASSNTYKGLVGVGIKQALPPVVVFNGNIHYDPKDKMAEYEGSLVFKASNLLYPIIEVRGEITPTGTSAYVLPALKFRIGAHQDIGVGFQMGVSKMREYDVEALLQYGFEL